MSSSGNSWRGVPACSRYVCVAMLVLPFAIGCSAPNEGEVQQSQAAIDAGPNQAQPSDTSIKKAPGQVARPHMQGEAKQDPKAAAKGAANKPAGPKCATPTVVSVPRHDSKSGGTPKLAIESEVSVAPPAWPSNQTKHSFKVTNEGDAQLHIRLKGG